MINRDKNVRPAMTNGVSFIQPSRNLQSSTIHTPSITNHR
jgi:hypothetical protein